MTNTIERLIGWLKANGENELDGRTYSFSCKDEPYMEFAAEWQQWDGHDPLFVGYHTVVNGDVCNDPQFTFRIENGEVTNISCDNWMVGTTLLTQKDEVEYALNCVDTFYKRHMAGRSASDKTKFVRVTLKREYEVIAKVESDLTGDALEGAVVVPDNWLTANFGSHWESEGWEVDEVTDVTESHSLDRDDSWIEPTFEVAPD